MYKAKVATCSEILTKHSRPSEHHVEFLNVKPGGTYRKRKLIEVILHLNGLWCGVVRKIHKEHACFFIFPIFAFFFFVKACFRIFDRRLEISSECMKTTLTSEKYGNWLKKSYVCSKH